jgi:hypothetical protein
MVGMDKMFFTVMHQRKSKQGLHYKTTMMRNTKKNQGFIDLNYDAGKFQTLKKFTLLAPKTISFFLQHPNPNLLLATTKPLCIPLKFSH